jgi:reactive intermediate/imine deaminase
MANTLENSRGRWPSLGRRSHRGYADAMKYLFSVVLLVSGFAGAVFAKEPAKIEFLNSGKVYPMGVPLSEAVRVGDTLYLSGQIGIQPGTLKLVPGGLKEEAGQTLNNIRTTLEAHGYSMRDVIKCTIMLADIAKWGEFNEIYKAHFSAPYPARSAMGTNGLALGAQVEVECIAQKGAN